MKKKIKKKSVSCVIPGNNLSDLALDMMETAVSFGKDCSSVLNINSKKNPHLSYPLLFVKANGFFWFAGYHYRLSKDRKKYIRLNLFNRKMYLKQVKTVKSLFRGEEQRIRQYNKLVKRINKKKNHDGRK